MGEPTGEPRLRVGLAQNRERAAISLRGTFRVAKRGNPGQGLVEQAIGPVEGLEVTMLAGAVQVVGADGETVALGDEVRFEPTSPDAAFVLHAMTVGVDFHWQHEQDLTFRGVLHLSSRGTMFDVIDEVGLEDYLQSVISSEMSARCPPAMLQAHAVISRSWLLAQLEEGAQRKREAVTPTRVGDALELVRWYDREDHLHFDVCADDHCQRYQGISRTSTAEAVASVDQTRGLVLVSGGKVCDARFAKSCGGMTEIFPSAWGDEDVPYLQAFPDTEGAASFALPLTDEAHAVAFIDGSPPAYCNTSDRALLEQVLPELDHGTTRFYRWEETVSAADVRKFVREKAGIDLGTVTELRPLVRGPSGRLVRLEIVGETERLVVGKELEIRRLLSKTHLYSSAFTVRAEGTGEDRVFHLRGAGWGHGVGLCQIGAAVMADQGHDHEAILAHYYRGAGLERRY